MSTKPDVLVVTCGGAAPRGLDEALEGQGARISTLDLPATARPEEIQQRLATYIATAGTPSVLVNQLHPLEPGRRPEQVSNAAIRQGVDVNLTRTLLSCQAVGRVMIDAGGGTIVVVFAGSPDDPVSRITDAAAYGLVRVLSVEWAPHQVRVIAVSPTGPPGAGRDAAVAETIGFLISDDASYVT
ncbi:MAG: SDR family oxidoreductase, partial [Stackebrandtia sp.]